MSSTVTAGIVTSWLLVAHSSSGKSNGDAEDDIPGAGPPTLQLRDAGRSPLRR